jgi:hypothetical protein
MVNGHLIEGDYDRDTDITGRPLLRCVLLRLQEHLRVPLPSKKVQELPADCILRYLYYNLHVPFIPVHFPGDYLLDQ